MKRADFVSERYELTDMQRRVRENYARLRDPTWVTVASDRTIEEVETEVFNIVIKELTKSDKGRIEKRSKRRRKKQGKKGGGQEKRKKIKTSLVATIKHDMCASGL